jgi:hypothetical protein
MIFESGPPGGCGVCGGGPQLAAGFDPDAGSLTWTLPLRQPTWMGFYDPILTNRGTVLVAAGTLPYLEDRQGPAGDIPAAPRVPALLEIDGSGQVLSTCDLPGSPYSPDNLLGATLYRGHWFVSRFDEQGNPMVQAYAVPGADVDPHGWVCQGGNPARTARPW